MKGFVLFFLLLLNFCCCTLTAYSFNFKEIEELVAGKPERTKIAILDSIAKENRNSNPELALKLLNQSMSLSKERHRHEYGIELILLSKVNRNLSQMAPSIHNAKEAAKVLMETGDTLASSDAYLQMGITYYVIGSYELSIGSYFEALRLGKKYNSKETIAVASSNVASVFFAQEDYSQALKYYLVTLPIFSADKNKERYELMLDNISTIYLKTKDYKKAVFYNTNALLETDSVNFKTDYAEILANGGSLYSEMGELDKALEYLLRAKRIVSEAKYLPTKALIMLNLGDVYCKMGKYQEAIRELNASLDIAKSLDLKVYILECYQNLYQVYEKMHDEKKAYSCFKEFSTLKDSIYSVERISKSNELTERFEIEQQEKEIEILEQKDKLKEQLLEQNSRLLYASSAAGFSLIVLALVMYTGNRNKRIANELMKARNREIQVQKAEIEEKNKDITDSINYAQRIQETILPQREELKKYFRDSCILYMPRDAVSGDFYWFSRQNEKIVLAVADCTGHGVPGALMSMIGYTLLNEIVNDKGITSPPEILFHLREGIIHALKQTGASGENKDGMDITLCCYDPAGGILSFSGANNPLYLVRGDKLVQYKADKQPIGIYSGEPKPFTEHKIAVEKDDCFYLFTDGYADQFGGKNQKKFKYRSFQELLLSLHKRPFVEQKEILESTFKDWKGTLEQVDDVCLIGIKI